MAEYDGSEDEDSGSESEPEIDDFSDSEHIDESTSYKLESAYDDPGHEIVYISSDAERELDTELDGGSESAARTQTGGRLRGVHRV
ncbi:hypothetical protein LTR35_006135 [Friedmanniomyces endolithicus]|uniref:Uncharacterized protein n=1 Tax=Friedmanniomyces endolithicus TaxID=329885 RepID=A0AAN6JFD6_9PEZI|nr:hypothetical protein LTR35_006135 [Friedmanniomyces endolithicus]KAK0301390.1 hypothetical protein LTS00_000539 [Friedmanniomyces endolithicus]KAK0322305.1 hypothetical protein LTR82_006758 [Friedmanniomyces endolithicus]KAK1014425.1 hypothetical protein LTR54_004077 [Friedmanniomyces endolithicus]